MKKLFLALILVLILSATSYAQTARSSGLLVADTAVRTGQGQLAGVYIITNGSNDATLICYDGTSAAGTVLFKGVVTATSNFGGVMYNIPIDFSTGCFCDVTGTGAAYIVYTK